MAVVPAAGPLVQVAPQGAEVAHLRRGQPGGGLREGGITAANVPVGGNIGNSSQRADANAAVGSSADAAQSGVGNGIQLNQRGRPCRAVANLRQQVGAARDGKGVIRRGGQQAASLRPG